MFAFQTNPLQRHGDTRHHSEFLKQRLKKSTSLFLPVIQRSIVTSQKEDGTLSPVWLTYEDLNKLVPTIEEKHLIYLGEHHQRDYFTFRLKTSSPINELNQFTHEPELTELRQLLKHLTPEQAHICNVAVALEHWHNTHQYCGFCGHQTYASQAGFVRVCSNQECHSQHFPRTDSAVICAITHKERLLLGRQKSWPDKLFSVIAGFVEPGETLEQAVAREAHEETGLSVSNIQYYASQPWPFPQSLMIGFTAEASGEHIRLLDEELEQARWFTRAEVHQLVQEEKLFLPFAHSISRTLVDQWLLQDR